MGQDIAAGQDDGPFVSVVINCYNYGRLLPRLFRSIEDQVFRDFEVVIVNDCSTDNSHEAICGFIDSNPDVSVKYIRNERRKGIGEGQNSGAYASSGKYLMFVDADDWMDPDCLQILADKAAEEDSDRVIGSYRYVNDEGKVLKEQIIDGDLSTRWFYTMQQANLFKRSVYVDNGIVIGNSRYQDNEATFRFDMFCRRVSYVQAIAFNYYIHVSESRDNQSIYEKMVKGDAYWRTAPLFETYRAEIYDKLTDSDRALFEYAVIRFYYSLILQRAQGMTYRQSREIYDIIKAEFKGSFPEYLHNELVFKKPIGNGWIRRRVAAICAVLEKTGTMKLFLLPYSIITRNRRIMN